MMTSISPQVSEPLRSITSTVGAMRMDKVSSHADGWDDERDSKVSQFSFSNSPPITSHTFYE